MSFHAKLESIIANSTLSQKNHKDLIKLIKNNALPYKELLLEAGLNLYTSGKLNDDESKYQIIDAMQEAAMKTRNWDVYIKLEQDLYKVFGRDRKIRLHHYSAMRALRSLDTAQKHYDHLLSDNLADAEATKGKISIELAKGETDSAIADLNKYIETNPLDKESWLELADIYMANLDYQKAVFCYEELLMIAPDSLHIMNRIAEIYYTLGKKDHLRIAKKYFSFVLLNHEANVRALWGLKYTCLSLQTLGEEEKDAETTVKLLELIEERTKSIYSGLATQCYVD